MKLGIKLLEMLGVVFAYIELGKLNRLGKPCKLLFGYSGCGKGGGKPDNAMGGGTDVLKLDDALASVDNFVAEKLG